MVSEKKKEALKAMKQEAKDYSAIGIVDMHKLPSRQLLEIRNKLRGKAKIKMVKKRLITRLLKESKFDGLEGLETHISGEPALLLTKENPFSLARILDASKSQAAAKPGDVAPHDIMIKAGPTPIAAGPAIGDFQKLKIPVMVDAGKIAIRQDTVVARKGEAINKQVADLLTKLGETPMEIGLNLKAVWEGGFVYPHDVLFVPLETYVANIKLAAQEALNLTVNAGFPTADNAGIMLSKAHREALALALEIGLPTKETIGRVLAKAKAQAEAVKSKARAKQTFK